MVLHYVCLFSLPSFFGGGEHHFYLPAQLVGGFTLSHLLDKPWSQVSSLLPPGTCLQFLSRIAFSIPTVLLRLRLGRLVIRLSLGRRLVNLLPVAQRTNALTFGIVEDTSSNPTSNISFQRIACAWHCLLLQTMSPWVPRIWIEVWVGTYDRIRRPVNRYVPKIPPFQGGENVIRLYPGLGN